MIWRKSFCIHVLHICVKSYVPINRVVTWRIPSTIHTSPCYVASSKMCLVIGVYVSSIGYISFLFVLILRICLPRYRSLYAVLTTDVMSFMSDFFSFIFSAAFFWSPHVSFRPQLISHWLHRWFPLGWNHVYSSWPSSLTWVS